MKKRLSIFLFASLAAAMAGPVRAEPTVPAGKTVVIFDLSQWIKSTCASTGKTPYRLINPPQHGTVKFVFGVSKLEQIPAHCRGKVRGVQVLYTPARGYTGPDGFDLEVKTLEYEGGNYRGQMLRPRFTVK